MKNKKGTEIKDSGIVSQLDLKLKILPLKDRLFSISKNKSIQVEEFL